MYPRYNKLRKAFLDDWQMFFDFAEEELGKKLPINQCEVTYVNTIEGIEPGDINQVYSFFGDAYSSGYLGKPEGADIRFRFALKKDGDDKPWGRLHVETSPVYQSQSNRPVIRLSLTARGTPTGAEMSEAIQLLDACHETVIQGFASITTDQMHKKWGVSHE